MTDFQEGVLVGALALAVLNFAAGFVVRALTTRRRLSVRLPIGERVTIGGIDMMIAPSGSENAE